jgi:hypothetical protein
MTYKSKQEDENDGYTKTNVTGTCHKP